MRRDELRAVQARVRAHPSWGAAVEAVQRLKQTVSPVWPKDATKFLDLDFWLEVNVLRAIGLDLHRVSGLRVLDLGCGTGLFLLVCKALGHAAVGLDLPERELPSPEREIYVGLCEAFGVHVIRQSILPFEPLQLEEKVDLITSYSIRFNKLKTGSDWGRAEWKYFVDDMLSHLQPGGRLKLKLNPYDERFWRRKYLDKETHHFFKGIGEIFDGNILIRGPASGHARLVGPSTRISAPQSDQF